MRKPEPKGRKKRFTPDEVRFIRGVYKAQPANKENGITTTFKSLAEAFGVSDVMIFKIIHKKAYAWVPGDDFGRG